MRDVGRGASWIGVDVGGTNLRAGVLDDVGRIRSWISYPHRMTPGGFQFIAEGADEALHRADLSWRNVAGMGVAVAGLVDSSAGVVLHSAKLGWHGFPLGGELSRRLGIPVVIETDVAASAEAELAALPGGNVSPWLYVSVGTGIGACVILDQAGERARRVLNVGHEPVAGQSRRCQCGEYGCLETIASGYALTREARTLIAADSSHSLHARVATITGKDVAIAASQGDSITSDVLAAAGRACGRAVASLVNLLTPTDIGLGGGVITPGSPYVTALIDEARSAISPLAREALRFHCARLGERSGVIGGVELARRRLATTDQGPVTLNNNEREQ